MNSFRPLILKMHIFCFGGGWGNGDRVGSRKQMEVSYALPDRTLIISRPPKNRLPLVDFSYRPLFASLSVENILCIFGLLLTEAKVTLYERDMK